MTHGRIVWLSIADLILTYAPSIAVVSLQYDLIPIIETAPRSPKFDLTADTKVASRISTIPNTSINFDDLDAKVASTKGHDPARHPTSSMRRICREDKRHLRRSGLKRNPRPRICQLRYLLRNGLTSSIRQSTQEVIVTERPCGIRKDHPTLGGSSHFGGAQPTLKSSSHLERDTHLTLGVESIDDDTIGLSSLLSDITELGVIELYRRSPVSGWPLSFWSSMMVGG